MIDPKTCNILENSPLEEVPITALEYNQILAIQETVLGMMAYQNNANAIFAKLCSLAESLLPNSAASIMMKDAQTQLMNVLAAPSVPQVGRDALCGLVPGPGGGSCGNAVFKNEPQFVIDTFTDERWADIRQIAYDFNLCSCWSMPIRNGEQQAIGSFALSSFEHRTPAPFHKKLLETCAHIVAIILKNQQLSNKSLLYSMALLNTREGVIISDRDNNILEVNRAFEKITGYKESDVIGKNPNFLSSGQQDDKFYQIMWKKLQNKGRWSGEITNKKADGCLLTQWVNISAITDENSQVTNYLALFTDISEIKAYQEQINYMAYHDALTDLLNKSSLERALLQQVKDKSLILLNVNNFSYINTAYGFSVGDKLLIKIAQMLNSLLLQFNVNNAQLYRINADEFALLFTQSQNIEDIIISIQQYFNNITVNINNITLNISFNYGAVSGRSHLFKNSAVALKQAKNRGKNRYYIYDVKIDGIDANTRDSFITYNNMLHEALENDNIIPYFQGIRDNKTKQITKFEVLARLKHQGKVISPFYFLEPARLSGMLPEITKIIIDKSFAIMAQHTYDFSINITEDDLSRDYLNDYLVEKCQQYNIAPHRVILEILEGVSSTGKSSQILQLNQLKKQGYRLAIDDFGTEYSNFERILDLEIDFLKIDAKYIKHIDSDKKSYEIAKAIAYFARNVNVACVAEFVHNEKVQAIVEELGIDYSQGYYFSEPSEKIQTTY
ncbi:MAG: EAL domain-containing protein [Alteromonadaceae bacterium]|nr:EAL domain-containing protein [Alteromonadaceae bacterium]